MTEAQNRPSLGEIIEALHGSEINGEVRGSLTMSGGLHSGINTTASMPRRLSEACRKLPNGSARTPSGAIPRASLRSGFRDRSASPNPTRCVCYRIRECAKNSATS